MLRFAYRFGPHWVSCRQTKFLEKLRMKARKFDHCLQFYARCRGLWRRSSAVALQCSSLGDQPGLNTSQMRSVQLVRKFQECGYKQNEKTYTMTVSPVLQGRGCTQWVVTFVLLIPRLANTASTRHKIIRLINNVEFLRTQVMSECQHTLSG